MEYTPPFGALDIPHPRTASDVVIRSLAINLFAAVAYGHLLYLLGFRKPHGAGLLPVWLIGAFLFLPELVLLQLASVVLCILLAAPYRRRLASRFRALPIDLGIVSGTATPTAAAQSTGLARIGLHVILAVFNAIPLGAVLGAYRQRLRMRYHSQTYVANLGLDHRNGWVALGGSVAVMITLVVLGGLAIVVVGGVASTSSDDSDLPTSTHLRPLSSQHSSSDYDYDDDDDRYGGKSEVVRGSGASTSSSWSEIFDLFTVTDSRISNRLDHLGGGLALAEVLCATLIHQILLAATKHPVPLLLMFRVWYLWPVAGGLIWWLHRRQRIDPVALILGHILFLVLLTVSLQFLWDVRELVQVVHGDLRIYNFRWQVKDQVSAKHATNT